MSPLLTGFAFGGSAGTPKATVTGSTGSPTVDTTSRVGKTIYKFTGSGTITVGVGGTCEYLVIGGGNDSGAGGYIYNTSANLPAGTLTVTIGAGASSYTGNATRLGDVVGLAGGYHMFNVSGTYYTLNGGSAGGGSQTSGATMTAALSGAQGNNGGSGITGSMGPPAYGGGGGAGGAGVSAVSLALGGGNGGAGATNSITGTSTTYAAGGGGYGGASSGTPNTAGAANTGSGGGAANAGGSGFVVVVIG